MSLYSWGNYPKIQNRIFSFTHDKTLKSIVTQHSELIPYGNGRSYGDSALSKNIIRVKPYNLFLSFDEDRGLLHLQAGVLLSEILEIFVPRGWFLTITPGTKFITVGGAISADVHGKNHHVAGCFSECVEMFTLMLADGEIVTCSKQYNSELFKATCGGMGLTGIILEVKLRLKKIYSQHINQTTIKTKHLKETFEVFEEYKDMPYSVAWIDCLAKGNEIGKSLLTVGDFSDDGDLDYTLKKKFRIPFVLPTWTLNPVSIKAFNWLYYRKIKGPTLEETVGLNTFFYPLDAIENWNRIYGKNGFTQYQFILPKDTSYTGLEEILQTITGSQKGSFLAVLKLYGIANDNYLSFPMEGYSLALDFKIEKGIFFLLNQLDKIVLKYGGRIYLAKDVRVSKEVFEQGYPKIEQFRSLRKKYKLSETFNSLQSQRVGI